MTDQPETQPEPETKARPSPAVTRAVTTRHPGSARPADKARRRARNKAAARARRRNRG